MEVVLALLLEAEPIDPMDIALLSVFWGSIIAIGLASTGFGMWFVMTPIHTRWGDGARFFLSMPFVFLAVCVAWPLFGFVIFPIWAAFRWRRTRRDRTLAGAQ